YKLESFKQFKAMVERINHEAVGFLAKAGLPTAQPDVQQAQAPRAPQQQLSAGRAEVGAAPARPAATAARGPGAAAPPPTGPRRPVEPVRVEKKVGRNDPCPCGSGKKYKQCHGR
ncbi:MAG: SEC-C metal-binding domain-containing protein, partial [Flavobacteriales bacterium]|nr:SEC-C metal-binding domain-containing protein [Flavobacteriales bacterium]